MADWRKPGSLAWGTEMEFNTNFKIQIASSHGGVHVVMMESKSVFL